MYHIKSFATIIGLIIVSQVNLAAASSVLGGAAKQSSGSVQIPARIEVFYESAFNTMQEIDAPGTVIEFHNVSEPDTLIEQINSQLPSTPEAANQYMQQFLNQSQGKVVFKKVVQGYQSVGRAITLGIEAVPAIVIDEAYVIYGEEDIQHAISQWREQRVNGQ